MFESYLLTTDGKEYIDANCIREALGIVDEYVDILGVIKKLREERDQLKEKCNKLKKRANAAYGVSCGYSGDKPPAFLCDVISYKWEFAPIAPCSLMDEPSYALRNDSIRVELELTPTANYKGTFDLEDLKRYIQEYGREKKLGVLESVDYQNAKVARAELAYLYKKVLGKEKLDRDLSPHEVMKAIHDEYKRVRDAQFASDQCLRSVYMHVHENTGYDVSDIYAAPDKLADEIITRYNSASARLSNRLETLSEIDGHIDELCDKYTVVQPDRKSTTKERLDYIFGVLAEHRDLANSDFNKAEGFRKDLREFRDNVCEALNIRPCTAYKQILEEIRDVADRYHELEDFRAACSVALNVDADELFGSPRQNDKYILEQIEKLKKENGDAKLFKRDIRKALCVYGDASYPEIVAKAREVFDRRNELIYFKGDVAKAAGLSCDAEEYIILQLVKALKGHSDAVEQGADKMVYDRCTELEDFRADILKALDLEKDPPKYEGTILDILKNRLKALEHLEKFRTDVAEVVGMNREETCRLLLAAVKSIKDSRDAALDTVDKAEEFRLKWHTQADNLARLRSNICTALCLGGERSDEDILKAVAEARKKCNDLIVFRNDVAKAIGLAYIDINSDIVNRVMEIRESEKLLIEFRDSVAKAMDMDYPTTNNFIVKRVEDIYKGWGDFLASQRRDLWEFRRNAIEDLKSRGFCFRPEENETLPEIYDKLLKRYDWAYGEYKEQYRLRQCWHVRWESENERANGVQKALDREREKCRVKDISLETAKKQYEKVCGNLETAECALNGMKSKVRSLQEEKTKVISALGQDIWDDAVK